MTTERRLETLANLPPTDPTRLKVDRAIRKYGRWETSPLLLLGTNLGFQRLNRTDRDYLRELHGLIYFFDYVRGLDTSNTVVDVGAGTTRGAARLSGSYMARDLNLEATVLKKTWYMPYELPDEKIHETAVEYMEGIPDNSVAGILGVYSILYSRAPEYAVRGLDQVMTPGGVIKAIFRNPSFQGSKKAPSQTASPFIDEWSRLEYNAAVTEGERWDILIAIKPGGQADMTASRLLELDESTYYQY